MGASVSLPVGPSRGAFREACVGLLQELRQGLSDNPMDGVVGASKIVQGFLWEGASTGASLSSQRIQ